MRFYGEYCFIDIIPLDKAAPEYGEYERVLDHGVFYATYMTPYKENSQRHHDAPDYVFGNTVPGENIGPWDKGEEVNEQKE